MALMIAEPIPGKRDKWTDEERELVRQWYGKVSTPKLAEHLGRPARAINLVASCLGVSANPRAERHHWTSEDDEVIRREYQHSNDSMGHLASKLSVSMSQIKGRIHTLGVAQLRSHKLWSPEEKAQLQQLIENGNSVTSISRKMHRGVNGVRIYANRHLNSHFRTDRDGWYTKQDVGAILGVGHRWIQARIDNGTLRASFHHGHRPSKSGGAVWHINQKDLTEFIRQHAHELNGRNVDIVAIVDLLAGIEGYKPDRKDYKHE